MRNHTTQILIGLCHDYMTMGMCEDRMQTTNLVDHINKGKSCL